MPRAGLHPAAITEAAATLVDEAGCARLSMVRLAQRLGVRTPSLYKHIDGMADLTHRIAVLALTELGDAIRDATQGRAGDDAFAAAAQAMRTYVTHHPGRYATTTARPTGPADPLIPARDRLLHSFAAVLHGYRMDPDHEIHALRTIRSMLHGFATLEAAGGFQIATDVDDSFAWMITMVARGLHPAPA